MARFCSKICLFLGLQAALFYGLLWKPGLPGEDNYLAAAIDKHARLEGLRGPRLVVVGGSNAAFGVRCDLLEKALGLPVVNMGLVAGLGIDFLLNEIQPGIRKGDIILLSFEYDLFGQREDPLILRQLLELRPASLRALPPRYWKRFVTDFGFSILGGVVRRAIQSRAGNRAQAPSEAGAFEYRRAGFNACGSYTGHYHSDFNLSMAPRESKLFAHLRIHPMLPAVAQRLRGFAQACFRKGALCFYTCPPQPGMLLGPELPAVEANLAKVSATPRLQVLDRPQDQEYSLTNFFDTGYHLRKGAAEERTRKIIQELRRQLPGRKEE